MASNYDNKTAANHHPMTYQIRIQGHLGCQWAEWFDGLTILRESSGHTLLTGPVVDQAALYGLLKKVRDLGLPLLALNCVEPDLTDASGVNQNNVQKKEKDNDNPRKSKSQ